MDRFLSGSPKPTQSIHTACVEICESKYDRVLFSVIDSPGLDFMEGRELKLERQVSSVIKYIDAQYADTLSEVCAFLILILSRAHYISGIQSRPKEQRRPTHSSVRSSLQDLLNVQLN